MKDPKPGEEVEYIGGFPEFERETSHRWKTRYVEKDTGCDSICNLFDNDNQHPGSI